MRRGAPPAAGQSVSADTEAVRRAALDYLEGFCEGDSTRHIRSIMPEVYKYGYMWLPAQNRYNGSQMTWQGFKQYVERFNAAAAVRRATVSVSSATPPAPAP